MKMEIINENKFEGKIVNGLKGEGLLKDILNEYSIVPGIRIIKTNSDVPNRPHIHEEKQIVYILNGKTSVFNGKVSKNLNKGDFIIFEQNEEHYFTSYDEEVFLFEIKWK